MPTYANPRVRDAVRSFNRHVLNPVMLLMAGRRHWYAAAIAHSGRSSGRRYTTPVVAEKVSDGIIVPLPYGTGVDWLRNVLAANHATVMVDGHSYDVVDPRVIDSATAEPQLSARRRGAFHRFGIDNYVKFALAEELSTGPIDLQDR